MSHVFHRNLFRRIEQLESRRLLTTTTLVPTQYEVPTADQVGVADVDGDSRSDLIAAVGSELSLIRNNGNGFDEPRLLWSFETSQSIQFLATDADADNDVDLLVAVDGRHQWLLNDGGTFELGSTFAAGGTAKQVADLNQDGQLEIIVASGGSINVDYADGRTELIGQSQGYNLDVADLDGDGDLDIVSSSTDSAKVEWYENDGTGIWTARNIVNGYLEDDGEFAIGDMDQDGDIDIVTAAADSAALVWLENQGDGTFETVHEVSNRDSELDQILLADMDHDGDLDVVTATNNDDSGVRGLVWYVNSDGQGNFDALESLEIANSPIFDSIAVGDFNGDEVLDVMGTGWGYQIFHSTPTPERFIEDGAYFFQVRQVGQVFAGDMDGDGDDDILAPHDGGFSLTWFENMQDRVLFEGHTIDGYAVNAKLEAIGDIDGDGDLDIITTPEYDFHREGFPLTWYENTSGGRQFDLHRLDSIRLLDPQFELTDFDNDGDLDILAAHHSDIGGQIVWIENTDGPERFAASGIPIARFGVGDISMAADDIDGDGDLDVASTFTTADGESQIQWHKNLDGRGTFVNGEQISASTNPIAQLLLTDVDSDGDIDLITSARDSGVIAYYENADGKGTFSAARSIGEPESKPVLSMVAEDIDADGDLDLVVAFDSVDGLLWYEWSADVASFDQRSIDAGLQEIRHVVFADLDGDNRNELIAATYGGLLFELQDRVIGDVNNDGKFDSSDLVQIFQAAEYEDDFSGNSTFNEGDWDQDGDFTSSDLVLAFQSGHYERSVAAAVDAAFADEDNRFVGVFVA
ncbi:FG-GAP-like repeat-containing protein [Planctomycetota bacterium]